MSVRQLGERGLAALRERGLAALRERAVSATQLSFTLTDPRRPDNPLVWVNPAFTETTGYSYQEAVGRNCRFLQGPDTDPVIMDEIRADVAAGRAFVRTVVNYRKDGTPFWNEMSIAPMYDDAGTLTYFVGVQADVSERVEAQRARDRATAQVAVAADRLALLANFSGQLAMCQQPAQVVELVADVLVPRVGTWCVVCTVDDAGHLTTTQVRHERDDDPQVRQLVADFIAVTPGQLRQDGPLWRVLRGEEPFVRIEDYDAAPPAISGSAPDERTSLAVKLGVRSLVVAPLLARGGIIGCVGVCADDSRDTLSAVDLSLVRDIATRGGLMLENTQLYARQRAAASTLQRSLLPRLPDVPGVEVAAAYVPSADEAAVGGDWYDVFAVKPDGEGTWDGSDVRTELGVVVGDVMGHNIDSAARMGKLSTIVRSYAWPGSSPCQVFGAVDDLLRGTGTKVLATCLYARLSPTDDGAQVRYASAGHPPAIVRHPDGCAELLEGGRGPMLGISELLRDGTGRPADEVVDVARGSTIICFTDGLVDAFGEENDTDAGLTEMCRLVSQLPLAATPQLIINAFTAAGRVRIDDVALVAIRVD